MADGIVPKVSELQTFQFWKARGLLNTAKTNGSDSKENDSAELAVTYETINRLWGGSGDTCELGRVCINTEEDNSGMTNSATTNESVSEISETRTHRRLITKLVDGPSRRHVHDPTKSAIKSRSYTVENRFVSHFSTTLNANCVHVPQVIDFIEDSKSQRSLLIMNNLLDTHPTHVKDLNMIRTQGALRWLARFHAHFWCMSGTSKSRTSEVMSTSNGSVVHEEGTSKCPLTQPARVVRTTKGPLSKEGTAVCTQMGSLAEAERDAGRLWSRGGYWSLGKRKKEYNEMLDCWDDVWKERRRKLERSRRSSYKRSRSRNRSRPNRGRHGRRSRSRDRRRRHESSLDRLGVRLERVAQWISDATSPVVENEIQSASDKLNRSCERGERSDCASLKRDDLKDAALPSSMPRWLREMDVSMGWTVLHGDFKAENLFFKSQNKETENMIPDCAACDFQWTGFGIGAQDVFHLLSTSLQHDLAPDSARMSAIERDLLRFYHKELGRFGVEIENEFTWSILLKQYDLAVLDFARYVIGTGQVFDEDWWYVERAAHLV